MHLDESYIHQHCHKFDDSIWDPNDEQDVQVGKLKHKGNCYCFLCAIQGPDPHEAEVTDKEKLETLHLQDCGGIVPGSVWTFSPQQKSLNKGDCHKVFNSSNFLQWWKEQLLPNLKQPSLIIMDNEIHHCAYPNDVPKGHTKKADWQGYLQSCNVPFHNNETVPMLKAKAKEHIKSEKFVMQVLVEAERHRILFTPPCHSNFQAIKLLWTKLKGNIGRHHTSTTTMTLLKQQLDNEFAAAASWHCSIKDFISASSSKAQEFYQMCLG